MWSSYGGQVTTKTIFSKPRENIEILIFIPFTFALTGLFIWATESGYVSVVIQLICFGIVFFPTVGFMVVSGIRGIRSMIFNRRLLKEISTREEKLGMREFLQSIATLDSIDQQTDFIRSVKNRSLLGNSIENLLLLERLVAQLQHDLLTTKTAKGHTVPLQYEEGLFGQWYFDYRQSPNQSNRNRRKHLGLADMGWEGLDELNLLLEQIKGASQA